MLRVENLKYTYKGSNKPAVENINFEINEGEVFGFIGPSGAGKTTTQRLIIGLLKGYDESIKINGAERSSLKNDFYEKIGVAFEFPNLYIKLTAYENLKLIESFYKESNKNIDNLLELVGLTKDKNKKVESFSKGMKMRLNFIRAIMHNPEMIFLDEPTAGLDPVNAKTIKDKILNLKDEGKTVFLTTHNMTVAQQLCDRVAFINEGRILVVESPKKLMLNYGKPMVNIEYLKDSNIQQIKFSIKSLGKNPEFNRVINNYEVMTIHSKEATLEDVFIQLTGKEFVE